MEKRNFSLISVIIVSFLGISLTGFILVNYIHTSSIKDGWISDAISSRDIRTSDLSETIQQDIISGNYPGVVYKCLSALSRKDIISLKVVLNDGYVVFSQEKPVDRSTIQYFKNSTEIFSQYDGTANRENIGSVHAVYDLSDVNQKISQNRVSLYRLFILVVLVSILIIYLISIRISRPIKELSTINVKGSLDEISKYTTSTRIKEIRELANTSRAFAHQLLNYQKLLIINAKKLALGELATQVSHDIRSPLAALDLMLTDIDELAEDKRIILRSAAIRIKDIANDLLNQHRHLSGNSSSSGNSVQLIPALIDSLLTEKRVQFRSKENLVIDMSLDRAHYGLFSVVDPGKFKRVISNLINNSVEALSNSGFVKIEIHSCAEIIRVVIVDNGKGIDKNVLPDLMKLGNTHGKVDGTGLGLYHAKKCVEEWGGTIEVESTLGIGTSVFLSIPKCEIPNWFVQEIDVSKSKSIVVIDDDESIYRIWKERFEDINKDLEITYFSSPIKFETSLKTMLTNGHSVSDFQFLFDYEFIGHKYLNGLTLIEKYSIADCSTLVTSHYEEIALQEHCAKLGIKIIPKSFVGFVPIHFNG